MVFTQGVEAEGRRGSVVAVTEYPGKHTCRWVRGCWRVVGASVRRVLGVSTRVGWRKTCHRASAYARTSMRAKAKEHENKYPNAVAIWTHAKRIPALGCWRAGCVLDSQCVRKTTRRNRFLLIKGLW